MADGTTRANMTIPSLDGLRTASILIVFLGHAGLGDIVPGGFGVTVFFVISGYLITTLMRLEDSNKGRVAIGQFYVRRVFRILPLFYFVLFATALGTVWFGLGTGEINRGSLLAQVFHVSNYWAILEPSQPFMQGTGVYWSLAIEEHYYLLFPWLFVLLARLGLDDARRAALLVAACVGVLGLRIALVAAGASETRTYYGTDTRIDSILIGCALGLWCNPVIDGALPRRRLGHLAIAGGVAILMSMAIRQPEFRETLRYSVQSFGVVPIMMFVVSYPTSWAGRLLNARPIVWLGKLSYAFYLVHFIILLELQKHLDLLPAGVVALVVTIAVSAALQKLIEEPAHRMRNRLLRRPSRGLRAPVGADSVG